MSIRLQVVLEEAEMREIRRTAKRHRMTVSEWVRQALRTARRQEPLRDQEAKLAAIRAAVQHRFPAPEIDRMLAEIEEGYLRDETA
jgi:hypothetical protein